MQTFKDKRLNNQSAVSTIYIDHPCPIKHVKLDRTTSQDQKIINFFLDLKKSGVQSLSSNVSGWHSDWKSHKLYPDVLSELCNSIIEYHNAYVCNPRPLTENPNFQSPTYNMDAQVWFAEYLPGDRADAHHHSWTPKTSFVYYLDVEEGGAPLTFKQKKWFDYGDMDYVRSVDLNVHQGMLVMFPSFLHHEVKPTKKKRYVIAGNINDISVK